MAGLQVLEETFSAQGFHVLGFVSDDFGMQGGTDGQVDMCNNQYHVTFPEFAKEHVTNPGANPVFDWLLSQSNPGPASSLTPSWNFNKYLISKDGKLIAHWPEQVYPGDDPTDPSDSFDASPIVVGIKAELAK
jgi:glutathione peroxidase